MDVEFCPAEDVERAALMELDRMGLSTSIR